MKARDNPFRVARVLSTIRYELPELSEVSELSELPKLPASNDAEDRDGGRERGGSGGSGGSAIALLPRLEALGYRAAIVGPHGSGKTTLLEDLEGLLAERGFRIAHVRLDKDDPRLPREWWRHSPARRFNVRDIICLDGAEQLGPIAWLRFRRRVRHAAGLIITTHKPGRLPTLIECTTSVTLLHRIIQRLSPNGLGPGGLGPGGLTPDALAHGPTLPAAELFARHRGNLRDALRELYDIYAAGPTLSR